VRADCPEALRAALAVAEAHVTLLQDPGCEALLEASHLRLAALEAQREARGTSPPLEAGDEAGAVDASPLASAPLSPSRESLREDLVVECASPPTAHSDWSVASSMEADASFLPQGKECSVCMDQPNSHVVVPCGHKCLCGSCAGLIREQGICPMCRAPLVWVCEVYE